VIVADASALTPALLGLAGSKPLVERLFADGAGLHAPHVIDLEVTSALRKLSARGLIEARTANQALANLNDTRLVRHGHALLLPRIWQLRSNLSPYDAAYVALAELLDAPLLTRDRRLANAPGHQARVEVV
jgi:predicted nucleic acid-binding protein